MARHSLQPVPLGLTLWMWEPWEQAEPFMVTFSTFVSPAAGAKSTVSALVTCAFDAPADKPTDNHKSVSRTNG